MVEYVVKERTPTPWHLWVVGVLALLWTAGGALAEPLPWMRDWGAGQGGLFDDLPPAWDAPPEKPFGRRRRG